MHYNFGSLPAAGLEHHTDLWSDLDQPSSPMLARMLDLLQWQHQARRLPNLFDDVEPWHPDRGWLEEAAEALQCLHERGADIAIKHCEFEPGPGGYVAIDARCMTSTFEMCEGDLLVGGVALLREGESVPVVYPRVFRLICANGLVTHTHDAADAVLREGSVAVTIGQALEQKNVETVSRLRSALQRRVDDPAALLERSELSSRTEDLLANLEEGDDSLYGVVNALTAQARGIEPFPERLRAEADAGRFLELMLSPGSSPRRRPAVGFTAVAPV